MKTPGLLLSALGLTLLTLSCASSDKVSNKLPFGALDNPSDGATIRGVAFADGWALSEDGIDHVSIYLDRTYLQDAVVKGPRPDVIRAFPAFATVQDIRWVTELHTENMPIGRHEISAKAVSKRGAQRDFTAHFVNIEH